MADPAVKLLPCPFCGGRAHQNSPDQAHGGMVHCIRCGAEAFGPKWNRRVTNKGRALLDALKEEGEGRG